MRAISRETTLLASNNKNIVEKTTDRANDALKRSRDAIADALTSRKGDAGRASKAWWTTASSRCAAWWKRRRAASRRWTTPSRSSPR
jgi:hypothetical protein